MTPKFDKEEAQFKYRQRGTIIKCPCLIFHCVDRYCLVLPCYWGPHMRIGSTMTHTRTHTHTRSLNTVHCTVLLVSATRISFVS